MLIRGNESHFLWNSRVIAAEKFICRHELSWKRSFQFAMNFSNITSTLSPSTFPAGCPGNPLLWNEDYLVEKPLFILLGIVLSVASCPFIVLLNVLVIVAVKTRHGLQTMHNILLACMAGTDLLVGAVVQPSFIVAKIFALNGLSPHDHCRFFKLALRPFFIPFSASLFFTQCRAVCGNEVHLEIQKHCNHDSHKISHHLCLALFSWVCHSFL